MSDFIIGYKLLSVLKVLLLIYICLCLVIYLFQEKLVFFPQKLDQNYRFKFNGKYEEVFIDTKENTRLHGILFKAENSKGLIFYLHGNAGSLASWGEVAGLYTSLNFDIYILDYHGFGKSEGKIKSLKQLTSDIQHVYDEITKNYDEENVIILGYSIGTGLASKLSADNNPKLLILQAPYYSLKELVRNKIRIIPAFLLKYKLTNIDHLKNCKMPVYIFHGDKDEVIHYKSSLKLKKELKNKVMLITLKNMGHNGITDNNDYISALGELLAKHINEPNKMN
jgi:alpha-beta hydrolase superfamily lysophospholipase